jgi:hypothetical protein
MNKQIKKFDAVKKHQVVNILCAMIPGHIRTQEVGSVYCFGEGKDFDVCVLVKEYLRACDYLKSIDFQEDEPENYAPAEQQAFTSFRSGDVNILITDSEKFITGFKRAMDVCRVLDVRDRDLRILVCKIVRDGGLDNNTDNPPATTEEDL